MESETRDKDNKKLYALVAEGSSFATCFSSLVSEDPYRVGIGISQTAAVLTKAYTFMTTDEDFRAMGDKKVL